VVAALILSALTWAPGGFAKAIGFASATNPGVGAAAAKPTAASAADPGVKVRVVVPPRPMQRTEHASLLREAR